MTHWTDAHITNVGDKYIAFDEAGLEHGDFLTEEEAKDSLVIHNTFTLGCGSEAYKIPWLLGKMLKKILELRLNYFISADGTILTYWNGGWAPYHEVMKIDERMRIVEDYQ